MNHTNYKESYEQRFPFILPVLKSYKQNLMFENTYNISFDSELPELDLRWMPTSVSRTKKKKTTKKRKKKTAVSVSPSRLQHSNKYPPHFNLFRASSRNPYTGFQYF